MCLVGQRGRLQVRSWCSRAANKSAAAFSLGYTRYQEY